MAINCAHPANRFLTPAKVSTLSGSKLHSFCWLPDMLIGDLPHEYNWIEGVSQSNIVPRVIHYTEGGPWFENYREVKHADKWWRYYKRWQDKGEYEPIKETITVEYGQCTQ